jgi:histidinol-phosphate aminotransferase
MINNISVPKYIHEIEPYQGGRPIKEVARELNLDESKIIKLASNENPIGISPLAKEAVLNAMDDAERYPDGNGFYLKQKIASTFKLDERQIILGNGSNDILELVARTFMTSGDEAIYSEHAFAVYPLVVKAVGANGIEVQAKNYAHDLEGFLKYINVKTKIIFIANPNNPTGTLIEKSTLREFLSHVPKHVIVVLDEAYDEYLSDNNKSEAFSWLKQFHNLIISRSFSKAYGLAGLRVGYGAGHSSIIELMNRIRQPFNVNHLAQIAATASLDDHEFIKLSQKINNEGMTQIINGFNELGFNYIESYGNFISFKLKDESVAMMYYHELLKNGVIVRPIANYKLPHFLRVSIGLENENKIFLETLRKISEIETV